MIAFSPLRTRRLVVKLRELSIVDASALATIPIERFEEATTTFLQMVIDTDSTPTERHVTNPRNWTVQERMLVVGHYLAHTTGEEGGGANFMLGDGHYMDYLDVKQDTPDFPLAIGNHGGDAWLISPITGAMAEAIEQLHGQIPKVAGQLHWLIGGMAAQLLRVGETAPDPDLDALNYLEWLKNRMQIISAYPESEFVALLALRQRGNQLLMHFFRIEETGEGFVALPHTETEAAALPPARFPVSSCISAFAQRVSGKPAQYGG
ncbi:hypothetical protein ACVBEF_05820 [Glaciimonas sp. GG7]